MGIENGSLRQKQAEFAHQFGETVNATKLPAQLAFRSGTERVAAVMAAYTPKSTEGRVATIPLTLESLAAQAYEGPIDIYVGDNGLDGNDTQMIKNKAEALGVPVTIADGRERPGCPVGRNAAIRQVVEDSHHADQPPEYMLVIDDDSVVDRHAVGHLVQGLVRHNLSHISGNTIAVQDITQRDLDEWLLRDKQEGDVVVFPEYIDRRTGHFHLGVMLGLSSDGVGKENGSLVPITVAQALVDKSPTRDYYMVPPLGTTEDMILGSVMNATDLGRRGRHTGVKILDKERTTPEAVLWQNASWAIDHQALAYAIAEQGLQQEGITLYIPHYGSHWEEVLIANDETRNMMISITNPSEVKWLLDIAQKGFAENDPMYRDSLRGYHEQAEAILPAAYQLYDVINRGYASARKRMLHWLPTPIQASNQESTRYGREGKLGRVLGGLIGMAAFNDPNKPLVGCLGVREKGIVKPRN